MLKFYTVTKILFVGNEESVQSQKTINSFLLTPILITSQVNPHSHIFGSGVLYLKRFFEHIFIFGNKRRDQHGYRRQL